MRPFERRPIHLELDNRALEEKTMRNFKRFLSMMLAMAMLMVWMPTVSAVSEEAKLPAQEQTIPSTDYIGR